MVNRLGYGDVQYHETERMVTSVGYKNAQYHETGRGFFNSVRYGDAISLDKEGMVNRVG